MVIDHNTISLYGFMQSTPNPANQDQQLVEHSLLFQAKSNEEDRVVSLLGSYFLAVLLTSSKFGQDPGMVPGMRPLCPFYPEAKYIGLKVFQVTADSVDSVARV